MCLAAAFGVSLGAQAAQQDSTTQPTLRIGVTAVEVDAVVTDDSGRHVPDLKAGDFELLQDGKAQTITSFRYVPVRVRAASAATAAPPPLASGAQLRRNQAARVMAIVVDDLSIEFNHMTRLRAALTTFVDRDMQPDDAIAIVTTSHGVGRLQQFTNDKAALKETIARLQINLLGLGAGSQEGESTKFEDDRDAVNKGQQNDANSTVQEQLQSGALAAVQNVVRGMRDLPGRKSVVLATGGFALTQPMAIDPSLVRPDFQIMRQSMVEAFQRLVDEANRSFVVIHTLNTTGVTNPMTPSFSAESRGRAATAPELRSTVNQSNDAAAGPRELARLAGGLAFMGNDFSNGLGKALADQEGYYVLGYQPDSSTFKRTTDNRVEFHRLQVRLKKSGLKVRSRSGFFGMTDAEAHPEPRSSEERLWRIAASPFVATDLAVRVTPIFAHRTDSDIFKVLLHLEGAGLTFSKSEDGRYRAPIEVLVTLVDARGAAIEGKVFKFALQTATEPDAAARAAGFVCNVELPATKPGPYQLRVAARDVASNRAGTGYQFVRVPNLAAPRLALSGVALQGDAASANPAERRFQAASTLHYAFAAYNAQLDPTDHHAALTLRLRLYREGSLLVDGKPVAIDAVATPDGPDRSAQVVGDLQLSPAIKPGEYQLQIEVQDTRAPAKTSTAHQWIDFTVVAP